MQILKRGAGGFPEVDFSLGRGECSFCQACVNACEANVFRDVREPAWQHKVAIQAGCLPQLGVECRSCEDSCESRAIRFQRQLGGISSPQIVADNCNGCGACLSTCPTQAVQITFLSWLPKMMQNSNSATSSLQQSENWYVASLILQVKPEKMAQVKATIAEMPHTDIHTEVPDEGKLIVLVEADVERDLVHKMETLERLDGVAAFSLIYSQRDEA